MRVAVITPYWREPDRVLIRCLDSVAAQTHPCTHIMVADGNPNALIDQREACIHLKLDQAHGDNGDTPRGIGAKYAIERGFDAVAFLDADNWFLPHHIERLMALQAESGAEVLVSKRSFHRADGSEILGLSEAGDAVHYADTSCLMLTGRALDIAPLWTAIPKELAPICDRIFWQMLMAHGYKMAVSPKRTVAFTTQYATHYAAVGEPPPAQAKDGQESQAAIAWWNALPLEEQERLNRNMGFP
ncbi:MAG: glycosyltransferase [Alphaproteobacteria bacterium]|nr:glycosyltransferase [Alphaproteobacteria bacterium]